MSPAPYVIIYSDYAFTKSRLSTNIRLNTKKLNYSVLKWLFSSDIRRGLENAEIMPLVH
jgi:hypothetical protein